MQAVSIECIIRSLNEAGVRYLVVGGLAVNAHGYARMTRDLDLVIHLEPTNIRATMKALFGLGYQLAIPVTPEEFEDPLIRQHWTLERNMIVLKLWSDTHARTPIDIFIEEPFSFNEEIEKAVHLELSQGVHVPFVSLQTLIEMKKMAGRSMDLLDIQELTRKS